MSLRRVYLLLAVCAGLFVSMRGNAQNPAKGWSFDAGVGGGYAVLGYKTVSDDMLRARATGSYGIHAHIGVNYFFLDWLGVGIGADFTRYGGNIHVDGTMGWQDVTDTDGEKYNHTLAIHAWKEQQQELYLAPQFLIHAAIPAQRVRVLISAGVEYAFCLSSSYSAAGTLTHTGYYPFGNLTLHDLPKYGFYTTNALRPSGKQDANVQQLAVVGKVGVAIPVARHLDITANLIAKYAVYCPQTIAREEAPLGFYENKVPNADSHYFIPAYAPLTTTSLTTGVSTPFYVGLEIGVRYTIPQRKRYPCMCIEN